MLDTPKILVISTLAIGLGLSVPLHAEGLSKDPALDDAQMVCDKTATRCMVTATKTTELEDQATLFFATSTDGGLNWSKLPILDPGISAEGLTKKLVCNQQDFSSCQLYVSYINPKSPDKTPVYRVFSSFDGGKTWRKARLNGLNNVDLRTLTCSENGENCIASSRSGKIYLSHEYGKNWLEALTNDELSSEKSYAFDCNQNLDRCMIHPFIIHSDQDLYVMDAKVSFNALEATKAMLPLPFAGLNRTLEIPFIKCNDAEGNCLLVSHDISSLNSDEHFGFTLTSKDAGKTWDNLHRFDSMKNGKNDLPLAFDGLSCDEQLHHCVLMASYFYPWQGASGVNEAYISDDGGQTWSEPQKLPVAQTPEMEISALKCSADGMHCIAMGEQDGPHANTAPLVTYTSEDGGWHWSEPMNLSPTE